MKPLIVLAALVAVMPVHATVKKPAPDKSATTATATADAAAKAQAAAVSNAKAESNQTAKQDVDVDVAQNYERSAPSLAQGSIVIQTCSASGNVGGSNTNGAAFLGFGYITQPCYDLSYAAAYAALGQVQAACDILRLGRYGDYAKRRGIKLPVTCVKEQPAPNTPTIIFQDRLDTSNYVTKPELIERDKRIIESVTSK